jgi:hypothetical protein
MIIMIIIIACSVYGCILIVRFGCARVQRIQMNITKGLALRKNQYKKENTN